MAARFTIPARSWGAAAGARNAGGPGPGRHGPYAAGSPIPHAGSRPRVLSPASSRPPGCTAPCDHTSTIPPATCVTGPASLSLIAIGPCGEAASYWLNPGKGAGNHVREAGGAVPGF